MEWLTERGCVEGASGSESSGGGGSKRGGCGCGWSGRRAGQEEGASGSCDSSVVRSVGQRVLLTFVSRVREKRALSSLFSAALLSG